MRRPRGLSREDAELWSRVARTVKPLRPLTKVLAPAAEPDEAPRAKPEENTITEGKTSEGKRRRRRRRKKEHAENKGPEKQNRSAESEEETKAEAAQ